jgi:hypothetical protein
MRQLEQFDECVEVSRRGAHGRASSPFCVLGRRVPADRGAMTEPTQSEGQHRIGEPRIDKGLSLLRLTFAVWPRFRGEGSFRGLVAKQQKC